MRLVFAGTPEAAVPSLRALIESPHEVVAVVTRPDAPAGRGRKLTASPVAQVAQAHGIEILKPPSAKDPEFLDRLRELAPDACPVVAYGALLPQVALDIPKIGWINLHFSLLPAWRGAAPVQHAIWHGDDITGASTFLIEAGLDTGPVFGVVTQQIGPGDTAGQLLETLAESGAGLLVATMDGLDLGKVHAVAQPADGVSVAPKITVEDARIDWNLPASAIDRMIRACTPAPGAWSNRNGERIKIGPVVIADQDDLSAGQVRVSKQAVHIGTASANVALTTVKAPGKREMNAADWARGIHIGPDERLA